MIYHREPSIGSTLPLYPLADQLRQTLIDMPRNVDAQSAKMALGGAESKCWWMQIEHAPHLLACTEPSRRFVASFEGFLHVHDGHINRRVTKGGFAR